MNGYVRYDSDKQKWLYEERSIGGKDGTRPSYFPRQEEALSRAVDRFKNRWTTALHVYRQNGSLAYTQRYETVIKTERYDA